jgi:hypothetical protein
LNPARGREGTPLSENFALCVCLFHLFDPLRRGLGSGAGFPAFTALPVESLGASRDLGCIGRQAELKRLKHAAKIGIRACFCESAKGQLSPGGTTPFALLALFKSEQKKKARFLLNRLKWVGENCRSPWMDIPA